MSTIRRSLLVFCTLSAVLLALGFPSNGRAQDGNVKAVVDANHAAIHSLNIGDIANIWSHGADVTLVNPNDTTVAVGWDAVKDRWERVFEVVTGIDIKQTDGLYVTTTGDIARPVGTVHVTLRVQSKMRKSSILSRATYF